MMPYRTGSSRCRGHGVTPNMHVREYAILSCFFYSFAQVSRHVRVSEEGVMPA